MAAGIYSVEQVNSYIKNLFTQAFALRRIYVRGEISNCKYHTSGHVYFTLKDASGVLNAVMFRSQRQSLKIRLQNGMKIVAGGSINVYERDGRYQLYVQTVEADGVGALYQQYEKLKSELEEMGMFAPEYKRPVPRFGSRIGVVTAPTGAAIRDIYNIATRRNPCVKLYLYPALVQGEMASVSIAAGIRCLDEMNLDCIIVGRGGGSLEDLWAFNEEETAYAIFHAETPIISAVGHETDFTIADFVADLRAPTPSAAAELAVFDYEAYLNTLRVRKNQLDVAVNMQLEQKKQHLSQLKQRLEYGMQNRIKDCRHRAALCAGKLEALSPLKQLSGGFAYISDEEGKPVQSVRALSQGKVISLQFSDGKARAKVLSAENE